MRHLRKILAMQTGIRFNPLIFLLLILYTTALYAAGFEDVQQKIREHVLSNGMKFIILERPRSSSFFRPYLCECRRQ